MKLPRLELGEFFMTSFHFAHALGLGGLDGFIVMEKAEMLGIIRRDSSSGLNGYTVQSTAKWDLFEVAVDDIILDHVQSMLEAP